MKTNQIVVASLVGLTTCSSLVLASIHTYADNDTAVDEVEITVPVACTMTGTINTNHTATLTPGTYSGTSTDYANGIGKTTLTTFCNDNNGFSIYAIGFTGDTEGTNTLVGANTGATINTKAYEPTDTTSNWSMKVTKVTDTSETYNPNNMTITNSYDSWHAVPDDYAKVAEYKSTTEPATTDTTLGAKVETTYATYVATNQPADTYTGQVKYVMVHPHNATAPEKPEAPLSRCSTPLSNEVSGINYMQDINSTSISTILATIDEEDQFFLRDSRDNQPYCVSKLKDGKLWMTENLNIAGGTELSSTDTDFDSNYTLPTTNGWTTNNGKLVLPASAIKNDVDSNLTDSTQFGTDNYAYVFNSGNKTNCGTIGQSTPCYSYYSWDTATLGSGRTLNTENTDADYSICPKGWRLPTSGATSNNGWKRGDFYALATAYGANLESSPYEHSATFYNNAGPSTTPNFLFAGFYDGGSFYNGGSSGIYWSSTSRSDTWSARYLSFSSGSVNSADNKSRGCGSSVRCLFSGQ